MAITVEFYGVPRERAGVASALAAGASLRDVLADIGRQFPRLAESCFEGSRLGRAYAANVNGQRFVSDPETALRPGDTLLILAADAGG